MSDLGRWLMLLGALIVLVGAALTLAPRLPWLGRLPGDFTFGGGGWRVHVPLATSLLVSLVLSLLIAVVVRLIGRR